MIIYTYFLCNWIDKDLLKKICRKINLDLKIQDQISFLFVAIMNRK